MGLPSGPPRAGQGNSDDLWGSRSSLREDEGLIDWESPPVKTAQQSYTVPQLFGLFAMSYAYGFVFNSTATLVIPSEVQRLTPHKQSIWMSAIGGAGALSQLVAPLVGAWSDRLNRRVSFLVYGTFICVVGISLFFAVKAMNSMALLFTAYVVTMVGLSVVYSIVCALLNDCILPEQVGTGSGTLAILGTLGSGSGYTMFAMGYPIEYSYCCYIVSCVVCLGISVLFIPPNLDTMLAAASRHVAKSKEEEDGGCQHVCLHAISIPSPSRHPDFLYACLGRMLFNCGLAAQVYMQYYFRDIIHVKRPTQMMSWVAVMVLTGCIIAALPSGMLSDRVGKKPVIYTSIAICILSLLLFLTSSSPDAFLALGLLYGVGNVGYLSVDYAVGVAALPKHEQGKKSDGRDSRMEGIALEDTNSEGLHEDEVGASRRSKSEKNDFLQLLGAEHGGPPSTLNGVPIDAAKDLGIFAMSATAGTVVGQVLYGSLLDHYASEGDGGSSYSSFGFMVVFGTAGLSFFLAGLSVRWIRCVT
eukprot:Sspe_Gene.39915::Locus_19235_Transcript_1_1_Confidence_1.000_Length_1672::g.39915::m.39915